MRLLEALDERTIVQKVGLAHDEARLRYLLKSNTVVDFQEFTDRITDYYSYHYSACIAKGATLSHDQAAGRAKELLEKEYRRQNGTILTVFYNAQEGTAGGMRSILDQIAEGLKKESVEHYIREQFDRYVAPNAWEDKVQLIREFLDQCGSHLSRSLTAESPERYAHDFQPIIRSYISALQQTSSVFRRL
jgi:hypothetical protein